MYGGGVTRGYLVLEAQVDFFAVVEHGLIRARVRSEWARLRSKGLAQESSHVGHAGVGVISMRLLFLCLPLPLLSLSASLTMVELLGACCL